MCLISFVWQQLESAFFDALTSVGALFIFMEGRGEFMGWIIGISLIFILAACIAVGWKSLLISGVVGGVLFALYQIVKKSEENEATDADKKLANISLKIVAIIAVSIIIVGGFLFLVGIMTPQHTGYRPEVCGYCGGSGRLTSGKECGIFKVS